MKISVYTQDDILPTGKLKDGAKPKQELSKEVKDKRQMIEVVVEKFNHDNQIVNILNVTEHWFEIEVYLPFGVTFIYRFVIS